MTWPTPSLERWLRYRDVGLKARCGAGKLAHDALKRRPGRACLEESSGVSSESGPHSDDNTTISGWVKTAPPNKKEEIFENAEATENKHSADLPFVW